MAKKIVETTHYIIDFFYKIDNLIYDIGNKIL